MYESLRGYRFWVQGFEHSSDAPNENHVVSLKGVGLLTGLYHKSSSDQNLFMKLSTLTLLSMRNKKVDLSLGVSNVIDVAEILFAFLIKLFPHLMQKY